MSDLLSNDGSVDAAASAMPDIEAMERANPEIQQPQPPLDQPRSEPEAKANRDRSEDGKFKAKEPIPGDNAKPVEAQADDDDWLEMPAEKEGEPPERYKVTEVWEGYKEREKLKAELAKVQAPIVPAEIESALVETTRERQQYINGLSRLKQMTQPSPPDVEMMNPQNPRYNPEGYYHAVQLYQQGLQTQAALDQHLKEQTDRQNEENTIVRKARWQREQTKLKEVWPEVFADKQTQAKAKEALAKHYGIDEAFLASDLTLDHRIYALAKDALAYRESQAKAAKAVEVVRSKPKLIPGSARQSQTGAQRSSADAMKRLQSSGSLEDAMDALGAFIK